MDRDWEIMLPACRVESGPGGELYCDDGRPCGVSPGIRHGSAAECHQALDSDESSTVPTEP